MAIKFLLSKLDPSLVYPIFKWTWVLIPVYVLYCSWIYPFYLSPLRKIPTVPGFPLWGHISALITEEAGAPQLLWHQNHGEVIRFFLPFGREVLSVVDSDAVKEMTIRNPYNYPYPLRVKKMLSSILGKGLLVAQGESHAAQRKALAPSFSTSSIKTLSPTFWGKGLLLSRMWRQELQQKGRNMQSIEIVDWMNRTTLDIIGEAGFGSNIDSLRNSEAPFRRAYRLAFNTDFNILQGLRSFFAFLKYLPLQVNRNVQISRQMIRSEANQVIETKRGMDPEHAGKDIISSIIKQDEDQMEAGNHMTSQDLRDQVRTFMGAGHDTTSTAVCWALLHLSKSPEIQQKVRAEIYTFMPSLFDSAARDNIDSLPDPERLPYLDNVCREALRYTPPIPLTLRQSLAPAPLAGYDIPARTLLWISINAINRLPHSWGDDATTFNPDRWDHLPSTNTPGSFMTFSQGAKGCIGRKFAEMEMKVLLCCLLSTFSFERDLRRADPIYWKMWRVVSRPRDGIHLNVRALG